MRVMVLVKAKAGIMPSTGEGLHPSGECRLCLIPRHPKSRREREPAHDASGAHPRGTDGSNPVPSGAESDLDYPEHGRQDHMPGTRDRRFESVLLRRRVDCRKAHPRALERCPQSRV